MYMHAAHLRRIFKMNYEKERGHTRVGAQKGLKSGYCALSMQVFGEEDEERSSWLRLPHGRVRMEHVVSMIDRWKLPPTAKRLKSRLLFSLMIIPVKFHVSPTATSSLLCR
jgi:hypothetical protein